MKYLQGLSSLPKSGIVEQGLIRRQISEAFEIPVACCHI
jgi:hypothetical protein